MLTKIKLLCKDFLDLETKESSLIEHFDFHLKKHPEKSVTIDKILEDNILVIKILDLQENVN